MFVPIKSGVMLEVNGTMGKKAAITIIDTGYHFENEITVLGQHGIHTDYIPLEGTSDVKKIVGCLKGYDFVLAGPELWNRDTFEGVKDSLKMIVRLGTGVDRVDITAASGYGIAVCNTPGANACAVAQHALTLMLDLSMSITRYDRNVRKGDTTRILASDLIGKTVGLIGFGAVSRELSKLLSGFQTKILYHDIIKHEDADREYKAEYAELDKLIRLSDYISLHIPLNKSTDGMVDIKFLEKMKPTAYLVNTSRSKIVKEPDLIEAMQKRIIAGAGLDVFENQTISPDSPLLMLDNVVLTPYVAFSSRLGIERTMKMAIECLLDYCNGKDLKNLLNPQYKSNIA